MTLISELRAVVDSGGILDKEQLRTRSASWLGATGGHAAVGLVRPRSTAEVSEVLRLCHRQSQPWWCRAV